MVHYGTVNFFDSVKFGFLTLWCPFNVHVLVWLLLAVPRMWACFIFFLLCEFPVFSQYFHKVHGVVLFSMELFGFPSFLFAFMDDHDVDHPVVVYTENVYIGVHIHQHLYIYSYFMFQPVNIHL